MLRLKFFEHYQELKILCLGAHPDDIEIGCGGTILRLTAEIQKPQFYWLVLSGNEKRSKEVYEGARVFLDTAKSKIDVQQFRESYFPYIGADIKDYFEKLKRDFTPDLVFTHYNNDAHQDHRLVSNLTWNTFRDHLILEYEIPKYDGDLGSPNLYVHLDELHVQRKTNCIYEIFQTQKEKHWFNKETLRAILRIRGVESNSPSKYAEAFYCRKLVL